MSRGPTRRVRRLIESGHVTDELLARADREADLLEHPYIGVERLELARLTGAGRVSEREELLQRLTVGVPRRWWRPLGRHSALWERVRLLPGPVRDPCLGSRPTPP